MLNIAYIIASLDVARAFLHKDRRHPITSFRLVRSEQQILLSSWPWHVRLVSSSSAVHELQISQLTIRIRSIPIRIVSRPIAHR